MYSEMPVKESQEELVGKIRGKYEERKESDFDKLKKLDEKVKRPAEILAYSLGIFGALVLGTGMCLAMQVIGSASLVPLGIVAGVAGIAIVAANFYIYKAFLGKRRKKYSAQVLELSDKIMKD